MSPEPEKSQPHGSRKRLVLMLLRMLLGLVGLLVVVALVAHHYRDRLQSIGRDFVEHFGVVGMGVGTLLADGFHFPVPPQFYMLLSIAGGGSPVWAMVAICIGSLLGGSCGYWLAGRLGRFPRVTAWLGKSTAFAAGLFDRYGYRAVFIVSCTPIAYSMLCYLSGLYRLPGRVFALLSLLRVPRLIVFYYLIRAGWLAG